MAEKPSWIVLTSSQRSELPLVWTPGWQIIPARELPSALPKSLRLKLDSAFEIITPTSTGGAYLTYSANRVDGDNIDIEPFGLIVHSTGPAPYGVFIHHGTWDGRTSRVPSGFVQHVVNMGTGTYFTTNPPNGLLSGPLNLLPKPHRGALKAIINRLRGREDGKL